MNVDGYQVTDASPLANGGYSTSLVDDYGNVVATITRDANGITQANVSDNVEGVGFNLSSILDRVTTFLDSVAQTAQQTSDEAKRVANAAKGAVTGAQVGYRGPTNWTPWLIAGGVIALTLLANVAGSRRR